MVLGCSQAGCTVVCCSLLRFSNSASGYPAAVLGLLVVVSPLQSAAAAGGCAAAQIPAMQVAMHNVEMQATPGKEVELLRLSYVDSDSCGVE